LKTRERIEDLLLQAREAVHEGNRDSALDAVRKALEADPGEMLITEVILSMERSGIDRQKSETISEADPRNSSPTAERNEAITMDPKLEKAFRLSEEAYSEGNDAKALAYLKKAEQLFPGEPEVAERLENLKAVIRADNLVQVGMKKLSEGDRAKAVAASRKAFEIMPEARGLMELIAAIEQTEESLPEDAEADTQPAPESGAMLWADRIRAAVKDDRFEEAGRMVVEAVRDYPEDQLLDSFHTKLKRLGFAK
jgi:tetratricopeptide (TPR) repeat protein